MSKEFVPPTFKDFGKSLSDLFTKKYSYDHSFKVKSRADNLNLEAGVTAKDGALNGHIKDKYKHADLGDIEAEFTTTGKVDVSLKNAKLVKGVTVKIGATDKPNGKIDVVYKQDAFTGGLNFDVSQSKTVAEATGVVGTDGVSVGGQLQYGLNHDPKSSDADGLLDYNGGIEYTQDSYTMTVKTAKKADNLAGSYIHKVSYDFTVGAQIEYSIPTNARLLTIGGQYQLTSDTLLQGKFNTNGLISTMVQQRLLNPEVKIGLSTDFLWKNQSTVPQKFGASVVFGKDDE